MNPAVVAVAVALPAVVGALIGWAVGRTGAVRDTHDHWAAIAKGYRKARVESEKEINGLRAELAWAIGQLIGQDADDDPFIVHHDHEIAEGARWN